MHPARALWIRVETIHALTYFAPEHTQAFERAGLRGFWRSYFAGRAAPLGAVGPGVITAVFHGFHRDFVARAVPDLWQVVAPDLAADLRLDAIDLAMGRLGLTTTEPPTIALLTRAVDGCTVAGRPMFAANAELAPPHASHLALWHACTLLREHRGDGHVAALVDAGLDGPMAHVSRLAIDGAPHDTIQPHRGYANEDWQAATQRLMHMGWLDDSGALTPIGRAGRIDVESSTDRLASGPVARLGDDFEELLARLDIIVDQIIAADAIPFPNAMGLPRRER